METPENNETQEVAPSQGDKDEAIILNGNFCALFEPVGKPTEYRNLNLRKPVKRKISNFGWQQQKGKREGHKWTLNMKLAISK